MKQPDQKALFEAARDAVLELFPDALAIYVYGSQARGDARPDSDLDLAVLLPRPRPIDKLAVLDRLSVRLGREVDLVELGEAGDVLRREVLESGELIHVTDPDRVLAWEGQAITRYQRYREEVRDLLADFRRTGIGYGR